MRVKKNNAESLLTEEQRREMTRFLDEVPPGCSTTHPALIRTLEYWDSIQAGGWWIPASRLRDGDWLMTPDTDALVRALRYRVEKGLPGMRA